MAGSARIVFLLLACLGVSACAATGPASVRPDDMTLERQIIVAVHDEPSRRQARASSLSRAYGGRRQYRGSPQSRRQMAELARRHGLRSVAGWPIQMLELYCVVFEIPPGRDREQLIAAIAGEPAVQLVQRMQAFRLLSASAGAAAGSPSMLVGTGIRHAHQWATGRGVKVALIDTGLDSRHPGLKGRVLAEVDLVGSGAAESSMEPHGLAIAGVIAARMDFNPDLVGVAPESDLLALRACWQKEQGTAVCSSLTLAKAIAVAVAHGAALINLSLTGPPDPLLERLLKRAMQLGLVVVGAVPEDMSDAEVGHAAPQFPTSVPGVIPVRTAELAGGSDSNALPAPGENILTLRAGGGYGLASGSSLAAAHVSGVVALLLEHRSDLGSVDVRALLDEFTRPMSVDDNNAIEILNGCLAVAALVNGLCPGAAPRTVRAASPYGRSPASGRAPD
jgi:hypothetical protein